MQYVIILSLSYSLFIYLYIQINILIHNYMFFYSCNGIFMQKKSTLFRILFIATRKGLEPSTSGVTGQRSNQLSYRAKYI